MVSRVCLPQKTNGEEGNRRIQSLLIYFNKAWVFQKAKGPHLPQHGWNLPTASLNLFFPHNSIRAADGSTQLASSFSWPFSILPLSLPQLESKGCSPEKPPPSPLPHTSMDSYEAHFLPGPPCSTSALKPFLNVQKCGACIFLYFSYALLVLQLNHQANEGDSPVHLISWDSRCHNLLDGGHTEGNEQPYWIISKEDTLLVWLEEDWIWTDNHCHPFQPVRKHPLLSSEICWPFQALTPKQPHPNHGPHHCSRLLELYSRNFSSSSFTTSCLQISKPSKANTTLPDFPKE